MPRQGSCGAYSLSSALASWSPSQARQPSLLAWNGHLGPQDPPPTGLCFPTRTWDLHIRCSHHLGRVRWEWCGGTSTWGTELKVGTLSLSLPWPHLQDRPGAQCFPHLLRDSPPTPSPPETPTFSLSPNTFPDLLPIHCHQRSLCTNYLSNNMARL